MRWNLDKKVTAGFAVVLAILVAGELLFYRSTTHLLEISPERTHSRQVLDSLARVLVTIDSAETDQRGYLLTGEQSYLEPYKAAVSRLTDFMASLDQNTVGDPVQQHDAVILKQLIKQRRNELVQTVALRQANKVAEASQIVVSGRGKREMNNIRSVVGKMRSRERQLLGAQDREWKSSARRTWMLVGLGLFVAFVILLAALFVLNNEVSRRSCVEQALRHSEMRTRLLLDSIRDYAILMLDSQGRVTKWSPGAEQIMGYREDEILGKHFSCFFPNENVEAGDPQKQLETALVDGRIEEEGWNVRKDGSSFWANGVTRVVREDSGTLRGFSKVVRDITEKKRSQEEIQKLNRSLQERASELEAANKEMEAFTYSVSHDLRAPLRHVHGFSQLLVEEYGPQLPEGVRRYLDRIQSGAQEMGHLVDDLLNLGRIGRKEVRLQTAGLNSIVEQVVDDLNPETEGRAIEWKIEPLPFVECDPVLVKQVFANVLSNAVKYTRPREHAVVEVGSVRDNGEPTIFVRDNGVGFNMKYADKLFGVFQRLHRAEDFEGTGIGLAAVQKIIHKHGGRIWAEAELDKGATFYFTLGNSVG